MLPPFLPLFEATALIPGVLFSMWRLTIPSSHTCSFDMICMLLYENYAHDYFIPVQISYDYPVAYVCAIDSLT